MLKIVLLLSVEDTEVISGNDVIIEFCVLVMCCMQLVVSVLMFRSEVMLRRVMVCMYRLKKLCSCLLVWILTIYTSVLCVCRCWRMLCYVYD